MLRKLIVAVIIAGALTSLWGCNHKTSANSKPNVILILLDTLRADHLGFYGYERDTSPALDQFAKENLACRYAVSTASWTPVSVASIMTGLYSITHRMVPPTSTKDARNNKVRLGAEFVTLAEVLKDRGYVTASVTANPWFSPDFGLTQGFDSVTPLYRKRAIEITDAGLKFIDAQDGAKSPFFLYLHYIDPHDPYTAPQSFAKMYRGPLTKSAFNYTDEANAEMNQYDGEVRYTDLHMGRLFEYLRKKGIYDNTIIVIVSDHGEQFYEHGHHRHGYSLHNEEVHVPLLIHTGRSSESGKVIDDVVSTVDIVPTVFELLGISTPKTLPGISLLNTVALKARTGVISELHRHDWFKQFTRSDRKKIVFTVAQNAAPESVNDDSIGLNFSIDGVFDLNNDYFEQHPLDDKALAQALDAGFRGVYQPALQLRGQIAKKAVEQPDVKDDTLRELKSLGYFQ